MKKLLYLFSFVILVIFSSQSIDGQVYNANYAAVVNQCSSSNILNNLTEYEALGVKRRGTVALDNTLTWLKNKYVSFTSTAVDKNSHHTKIINGLVDDTPSSGSAYKSDLFDKQNVSFEQYPSVNLNFDNNSSCQNFISFVLGTSYLTTSQSGVLKNVNFLIDTFIGKNVCIIFLTMKVVILLLKLSKRIKRLKLLKQPHYLLKLFSYLQ